jgi:hypothetical protein
MSKIYISKHYTYRFLIFFHSTLQKTIFFENFNISENNKIIVKAAKVCTMNMPRYALEY